MPFFIKILSLLFLFLIGEILFQTVDSVCRQCGDLSGVACLTANTFSACFNGTISNTSLTCPGNTICTNTASICVNSTTSNQEPDCPYCGVCNTDMTFACLNDTSFAYCFGTTTPSTTDVDVCPIGTYCSITAAVPNFCVSDSQNSTCLINAMPPDTSTTTTTTVSPISTTTGMPTDPTAEKICSTQGKVGNFADPSDTTCKMFAYCFYYAGAIRSQFYMCPGVTLFDPTMQLCVLPSFYNCTVV